MYSQSTLSTYSSYSSQILLSYSKDTTTTEIYTLSLHDALPISWEPRRFQCVAPATPCQRRPGCRRQDVEALGRLSRSEEHTSELQSHSDLVCRLLLEKKKKR